MTVRRANGSKELALLTGRACPSSNKCQLMLGDNSPRLTEIPKEPSLKLPEEWFTGFFRFLPVSS